MCAVMVVPTTARVVLVENEKKIHHTHTIPGTQAA
jgi:hypothetical protein